MQRREEVYFSNILEEELANVLKGESLKEKISPVSFHDISQGINIIDLGYPLCACYILNRCISRLSREYCEMRIALPDDIQFEKGDCPLDAVRDAFWGEKSEMMQRGKFLLGERCSISDYTVVRLKSRMITKRWLGIWEMLQRYATDFASGKTEYEMFCSDNNDAAYYEKECEDAKRLFIDGVKNVILLEEEMRGKDVEDIVKEIYEMCVAIIESDSAISQGTAFHIGRGKFLTCYHVIYDDEHRQVADDLVIYLTNSSTKRYKASVERIVEALDLALVKVENWDHDEKFEVDMGSKIKMMDSVLVLGFPNYNRGDSMRLVEARVASTRKYSGETLYALDQVVYTGNSGGPVLSTVDRKVIGIVMRGTKNINTALEDDFSGFLPVSAIKYFNSDAS